MGVDQWESFSGGRDDALQTCRPRMPACWQSCRPEWWGLSSLSGCSLEECDVGKELLHVTFPRLSSFVPEEWAQLAGSMTLIGSNLLRGKFTTARFVLGSPYIKSCLVDVGISSWELSPQIAFCSY